MDKTYKVSLVAWDDFGEVQESFKEFRRVPWEQVPEKVLACLTSPHWQADRTSVLIDEELQRAE